MSIVTAGRMGSAPRPFTCPSWCVVDHAGEAPEDVFHRGERAWLKPDGSRSGGEGPWVLEAHVVVAEGEPGDAAVVVDLSKVTAGPYAELTVETADQFIRDLKTFTARVQQMRDQLAEQNGDRS